MNKVNNVNNIMFKGIKKMADKIPSFDEKIQEMINNLTARAEREVSEYGDFKPVYEEFPNPEKDLTASDFMLKIHKPITKNSEKIRNLTASVYNVPHPYKAERTIISGSKEEVLQTLKDKNFQQELKNIFKRLSSHLEDEL